MIPNRQSAWLMSFYIIFFYAYQYIMLLLPYIEQGNVCDVALVHGLIEIEISTGIFLVGYAIAHLPVGILIDRYGPQYVVAVCILLTVLGNYMVLSTEDLTFYLLGRFLIGFGSAAAVIGWFKIILLSYSKHGFIKNLGITIFLCFLIILGFIFFIDHLKLVFEWRTIVLLLSLLGIMMSLIFFIFIPRSYTKLYITEENWISLGAVFVNPRIIRLSIIGALVYGPLWGFCEGWSVNYFCYTYLMNQEFASVFSYLTAYGFFLGAPIFSYIIYKTKTYELGLVVSSFIIFICFLCIKLEFFNLVGLSIILWILGFFASGQIILFYAALYTTSSEHSALSMSIVNMCIMLSIAFFHLILG